MSEQESSSSQLSALFDGALPSQQAELVIRRALRDPAMRASWERYALIGACVRSEPLCVQGSIADRVQSRLAAERELNVSALPNRGRLTGDAPRWSLGRGALGGAVAAGVAVLSIFVVRQLTPEAAPGIQMAQADVSAPALTDAPVSLAVGDAAPGYTTPGANAPAQRRMVDASLGYYLIAHSEEAASALRSGYDLVHGGVELTEDEIRALR